MKKTLLTLLTSSFFLLAQAQLEPDESDRLRISIYNEDYTPDGNRNAPNFFAKINSKLNTMNIPRRGCIWKQVNPGTTSLCCCTKTESVSIESPNMAFFYGLYTAGSSIEGPGIDNASDNDYRNSAFLIMQKIINDILANDNSLLDIEKIEIEPALHPQAAEYKIYILNYKVWYKKCVEYNNCQNLGY
jgi:hypothetical protein